MALQQKKATLPPSVSFNISSKQFGEGKGREIPLSFPNFSNVPTPIHSLIAIVMGLISL